MPSPFLFLAYASNATVSFTADALVELLAGSRSNNERDDITGMLLYRGGNFLQALEGPPDAVRATFRRIEADQRHNSVDVLLEDVIDERIFADWSMAFEEVVHLDVQKHPGSNRYLVRDGSTPPAVTANDHHVFEFFASFRENMR